MLRPPHRLIARFAFGLVVATAARAQSSSPGPFIPNDPLFAPDLSLSYPGQWYLVNTAPADLPFAYKLGGQTIHATFPNVGLDANLAPAWQRGLTGRGVVVGIVGITGLQGDHPDLVAAYRTDLSRQFSQDPAIAAQPQGPLSAVDNHDTAVAGIAVARGGNGIGMAGAAPMAGLAAFRIDNPDNTINPAANQNYVDANYFASGVTAAGPIVAYADVSVRNRSYARTAPFLAEDPAVIASLEATAANNVIHVFAAGNFRGTPTGDTGRLQRNSLASAIAVAALGSDGTFADYSNWGASVFVTAPGARLDTPGGLLSPTLDRTDDDGYNPGGVLGDLFPDHDYTSMFNGTSATAPIVSGIIALGKELNPFLDVRTARHALAVTSRVIDPDDASSTGGWHTNGAGLHFNPNYGFGLVDAAAFVDRVEQIAFVTAPQAFSTGTLVPAATNQIVDPAGRTESLTLSAAGLTAAGVNPLPLEAVEVMLDVTSPDRNTLSGTLTSPAGTTSSFLNPAQQGPAGALLNELTPAAGLQWTFVANNFWGEDPLGGWQLTLTDHANTSRWNSYAVTFHLGQVFLESGSLAVTANTTAHSVVLDHASTIMSIAANTTFSVRDEFWVNDGTLRVDGRLQDLAAAGLARSRLRLHGGQLTGVGTIALPLGVLNAAGTVRPAGAGAVGTLTIENGFTQQAAGVLEIDLASNSQVDALVVRGGDAALGGTLRLNLLPDATIVAGPLAPVIRTEAGGRITGSFATVEGQRLSPTLALRRNASSDTEYRLEAVRDYLGAEVSDGFTPADAELATYLNRAATQADRPYENVLRAIDRQTSATAAANAIRAVAPFPAELAPTLLLAGEASRHDTILQRVRASDRSRGFFLDASYARATVDPGTDRHGYRFLDRGLLAGFGMTIKPDVVGGLFAGVSDSSGAIDDSENRLDGKHRTIGLSATWRRDGTYATAVVSHGTAEFDRTRALALADAPQLVRSRSDARVLSASVEVGRLISSAAFDQRLFAGARVQSAKIDGYREPGDFGWTAEARSEPSTAGRIGYELAHDIVLQTFTLQPFVSLRYDHEFNSDGYAFDARLTGDTTATLRVHGDRVASDSVTAEAGVSLLLPNGARVYLAGTSELGQSDVSGYSLHLGARHSF